MEKGGSNQVGGVVNMTRAMEALSPLLNHPRRTIIQVEALVTAAAALLFLQLILGSCRQRWHRSFIKYGLQVCNGIMFPLIVYTLGTMQSSPVKNSSYPVWAAFLIMASAGTTTVRQFDFHDRDNFFKKSMEVFGEYLRDFFYIFMFFSLLDPNTENWKTTWWHGKNPRASSKCVTALVMVVWITKTFESAFLVIFSYTRKVGLFITMKKRHPTQVAEMTEETANDRVMDSDPQNMKGCRYRVCIRPRLCRGGSWITIDQIWDCCGNSVYGKALKDLCLSFALFWRLVLQHYFGKVLDKTSLLNDHDFVFKKLLPSEGDFKKAFRIIEVELGFCYDFFFTKYHYIFQGMNLPMPFIQFFILLKMILILAVGVFAIRKSLVLETPNPIIDVHISKADYTITLLVLSIAFIVELVQAALYLASNWAQVSLACIYVNKHWYEPNAFIFGGVICFLRRVMISRKLRNKINQHSVIFRQKQPDPVEVSDAVKRAVARLLISTYGNNLAANGETSLWQKQMFDEYSWALKDLSLLEVMLIWHIATEYCDDISGPTPSNRTTQCRGFAANLFRYCAHLFGYLLQLLRPNPRRTMIARDDHRSVAVHLSRYCAYLIGSVPELLPYHKADIKKLAYKVMEERTELFGSFYKISEIDDKMKNLEGTKEEDDPQKIFQKGVKLGKQLKGLADGDHWEVLEDFWAETIIHAAKSHYTTMQHMQHLENGGEFLTHIWALLAHAGILDGDKDRGVRIPVLRVPVEQEANLGPGPEQEEIA